MSQLWLTLACIIYDSFAVAVFSWKLIEYSKDKDIEVTYLIEWCDAPKQYKLAQAFLLLLKMPN